jgi:hypothetical protein
MASAIAVPRTPRLAGVSGRDPHMNADVSRVAPCPNPLGHIPY